MSGASMVVIVSDRRHVASGAQRVPREQPGGEVCDDSRRCLAIPELGDATALAGAGKNLGNPLANRLRIATDQGIGALLDGDRTLGVFADRQAGDAECGAFLLQPTGIGKDELGSGHQAEHFQVALRG